MDDRELDGRLAMIQSGIEEIVKLLVQTDDSTNNQLSQEFKSGNRIKLSSKDEEQM